MVRGLTYLSKILIVLIIVLLFFSCGDKYCNESGIGMPLVGVYALETPPVEAKINSVTIYGVDQVNDSILYNNVSNLGSFYTPLSITRDMVKYVIRYDDPNVGLQYKYDTLTYTYSKKLEFETPECGAMYKFTIEEFKYTTHSIAYAELVTPEVNNLESQTVKIYYVAED